MRACPAEPHTPAPDEKEAPYQAPCIRTKWARGVFSLRQACGRVSRQCSRLPGWPAAGLRLRGRDARWLAHHLDRTPDVAGEVAEASPPTRRARRPRRRAATRSRRSLRPIQSPTSSPAGPGRRIRSSMLRSAVCASSQPLAAPWTAIGSSHQTPLAADTAQTGAGSRRGRRAARRAHPASAGPRREPARPRPGRRPGRRSVARTARGTVRSRSCQLLLTQGCRVLSASAITAWEVKALGRPSRRAGTIRGAADEGRCRLQEVAAASRMARRSRARGRGPCR